MIHQAKSDSKGVRKAIWRTGWRTRRTEANSSFSAEFATLPIESKGFLVSANSANCFSPIDAHGKGKWFLYIEIGEKPVRRVRQRNKPFTRTKLKANSG